VNLRNTEAWARLYGGDLQSSRHGLLTLRLADGDELVFPRPRIDTTSDKLAGPEYEGKEPHLRVFEERDVAGGAVNNALRALGSLVRATKNVNQDQCLTQLGRDEKLKEARGWAVANAADAWHRLAVFEADIADREDALYRVPQLDPGDAVGALLDRERRDWVRSLSAAERDAMVQKISRGEADSVTLALVRSPIPIASLETHALQAWRKAQERQHPEQLQQLEADTEHLQWAKLLARRAAAKIAEKSGLSGYGLFEAAAMHTPAMPTGPRIFDFAETELRAYQSRWNLAQKAA